MKHLHHRTFVCDKLKVSIHPDRQTSGKNAGAVAAQHLRDAIATRGRARLIVASAPSQDETLHYLARAESLAWEKISVFHMDEYVGLPETHPSSFRAYQRRHLLREVQPAEFHGIRGEAADPDGECSRYARLLAEAPVDVVCMGIGENGHIAFNDPHVADFHDPSMVKIVELDADCRQQQVNDACFPDIRSVPTHAMTLTCPMLMSALHVVCSVPGPRKARAVRQTLSGPIAPSCPASILRTHPSATLYLDPESSALLE